MDGGPGVTPQRNHESRRDSEETVVSPRETTVRETAERRTRAETTAPETQVPTPTVNGPGGQLHTAPVETKGPGAGMDSPGSEGQVIPRPGVH